MRATIRSGVVTRRVAASRSVRKRAQTNRSTRGESPANTRSARNFRPARAAG
jgi:hypothetical protein